MTASRLGFLQLCSERRFHRATMEAFEAASGLAADEYWIEARPGGAPSWASSTRASRLAHENGAAVMAWAAHGALCLAYPERSDAELHAALAATVVSRVEDFPDAEHYALFALPGSVDVRRVT